MWERVVSSAFSTQMPLASTDDYRVFDLPRERRKKRVFVYQNIKFLTIFIS